jgi:hypothetical protein
MVLNSSLHLLTLALAALTGEPGNQVLPVADVPSYGQLVDGPPIGSGLRPEERPSAASGTGLSQGPRGAATAVRVQPASPARLRSGSIHRSHKYPFAIPRIVRSYDTNYDETSGDPDEDDDNETSKFLNSSDDTSVPIIAWLPEVVPFLIALTDPSPPARTETLSPLFLTLQRLRC